MDGSWVRPNGKVPRSSGSSFISVVKSAELRDGDDSSELAPRASDRSSSIWDAQELSAEGRQVDDEER